MEIILALLKVINPIEWVKEGYKMPKYVKLTAIITCVIILFLPDSVNSIPTVGMKKAAFYLIPFLAILFVGEFFQEKYKQKQNEKKRLQAIEKQESERLKAEQEKQEKINHYCESFDYCDKEEQKVLTRFYYSQTTSIYIENVAIVRAMINKGIDIFSFEAAFLEGAKALTSKEGLMIINKFFDKRKTEFFKLLNILNPEEIKLMKDFVNNGENQIILYKKEIKIAKSIISKFKSRKFEDIYINTDGDLTISILYLAYLKQYFQEN